MSFFRKTFYMQFVYYIYIKKKLLVSIIFRLFARNLFVSFQKFCWFFKMAPNIKTDIHFDMISFPFLLFLVYFV